jgi:hypothetical protein
MGSRWGKLRKMIARLDRWGGQTQYLSQTLGRNVSQPCIAEPDYELEHDAPLLRFYYRRKS